MAANGAGGPMVGALVPSALFLVCVAESCQNCQELGIFGPCEYCPVEVNSIVMVLHGSESLSAQTLLALRSCMNTRLNCSLLSVLSYLTLRNALLLFSSLAHPQPGVNYIITIYQLLEGALCHSQL